ncbi:MAG TPA: DUF5615 family PIN-like protein [Anaerolineae bacterium]
MRFLADVGVSIHTVVWLRQHGHDALHLSEEGLHRLPDVEILEMARSQNRVLLTMDLDFGYLLAISKTVLPSVIIFRLADARSATLNRRLEDVLQCCAEELQTGAVISVTDRIARVRQLPI